MTTKHIAGTLSIFIATAVLLSSIHAAQVWGAAAMPHDDTNKKFVHEDGASAKESKIVQDLHHHSDKSGAQLIKDVNDHAKYFDNRTQRVSRDKKDTIRGKLSRWQRAWEEFMLMHHMLI